MFFHQSMKGFNNIVLNLGRCNFAFARKFSAKDLSSGLTLNSKWENVFRYKPPPKIR